MRLDFQAVSDVGRRRKQNEDSYLADRKLGLFVVCDGMGGHAAGEVASAMAVRIVHESVSSQIAEIKKLAHGSLKQRRKLYGILKAAVRRANLTIYKAGQEDSGRRGMGTTLTALLIEGPRAFVAHVGDCRLYLKRSGAVHQITDDHNLINELARAGSLGEERAFSETFTNALTRAVGVYPNVDVDTLELDLLPGDRFLICSDGLHGYFEEGDVEEGLALSLDSGAKHFVKHANASGGKDNITVVLVDVGDDEAPSADSARLKLTIDTLRQIPLFRHLSYAELVKVINVSRAREFDVGADIIRQGDEGEAFFVILGGRVTVEAAGVVVATLGPRRHFGEMSLVDAQPRSATVRAIEPTTLIRILRDDFYRLVRQDTVMGVKLLWNFIQTLSSRLRAADSALSAEDADGPVGPTEPDIVRRVSRAWAAHTAPFAPIDPEDLPPMPTPALDTPRDMALMTAATRDFPSIEEEFEASATPERMGDNAAVAALSFASTEEQEPLEAGLEPTADVVAVPDAAVDIPDDDHPDEGQGKER